MTGSARMTGAVKQRALVCLSLLILILLGTLPRLARAMDVGVAPATRKILPHTPIPSFGTQRPWHQRA